MPTPSRFRLTLLGSPQLATEDGTLVSGGAAQRHRLALLAILARSPDATLGRDVLMSRLWPESDGEQARNLLKVSLYVLRQAMGEDAIVSAGDLVRLDLGKVQVDAVDFDAAFQRGDMVQAVELYRGPFMEGFFLKESPELDHWIDGERAALAGAYAKALEALADEARARGDLTEAVERWRARAAHDPYDSRVALGLMDALVAAGSHARALQHASIHARLLEGELGLKPSAEVSAFVERLRSGASSAPPRTPSAPPKPEAPAVLATAGPTPAPTAPRRARWVTPVALTTVVVVAAVAIATLRNDRAEVARAVVREMEQATPERAPAARTSNIAAWELYQRAAQPEALRSDSAAREALSLALRAVDLDPSFAEGHASVARLTLRVAPSDDPSMSLVRRLQTARAHAAQAVGLDPTSAEAYATLGIAEMQLHEFERAEQHLRHSVELDPRTSRWREWLAQLYVWGERYDEELATARGALNVDPLSPTARAETARGLMLTGHCDEALATLQPLTDLQPPLPRAGPIAAQCHAERGMWAEAVEDVRPAALVAERGRSTLAYFLARAGRRDEAEAVLEQLLGQYRGEGAFWIAMTYAGLGDHDEAFTWLDRSVDDHSITFEIREPIFADLRSDPRFTALMGRLGLR